MKRGMRSLVIVAAAVAACTLPLLATAQDHRVNAGSPPATSVSSLDSRHDIVLAVANPLAPPPTHAGSSLLGYTPPQYYGAGQRAASTLAALQRHYGWHKVAGWPIHVLDVYCVVLRPPTGMSRDTLLKALAADPRVQIAQPLQVFSVYSEKSLVSHRYNDPYVGLQRGFVATDAALAQDFAQGNGVDVAIVDTGVDLTHPDLKGRIADTHDMVDDDAQAFDRDAHGTEVAGIIAADANNHTGIVGIAPEATLSIYKACWYPPDPGAPARCNSFTLAKALAAILGTHARIVNLSLGGPADPLLNMLLVRLLNEGRIVIAAMPPDGALDGFPDDVKGVITVRAADASPAPAGVLSAPGTDILTTQPDGGYDFTSGSSMAAAHVTGISALLFSIAPHLNAQMIHDLLLETSKTSDGILQVNAASAVERLHGGQIAKH